MPFVCGAITADVACAQNLLSQQISFEVTALSLRKTKGKIVAMTIRRKIALVICAIVAVLLVATAVAAVWLFSATATPLYIAHRGHEMHENTAEAFKNSGDYWGIECDVRMTSDGKIVINHNSDVTFADGSSFNVAQTTLETLSAHEFSGGYTLCTFSEYLQICKQMGKVAVVELKDSWQTEEISQLLAEIDEYYCTENVVIISFDEQNLSRVRAQSDVQLQYLINSSVNDKLEFCIENSVSPSIAWALINSRYVKTAHEHNLEIGAWTVNSSFANLLMKKLGVDYVTSDRFCN